MRAHKGASNSEGLSRCAVSWMSTDVLAPSLFVLYGAHPLDACGVPTAILFYTAGVGGLPGGVTLVCSLATLVPSLPPLFLTNLPPPTPSFFLHHLPSLRPNPPLPEWSLRH